MNGRVSKSKFETQGRGERAVEREQTMAPQHKDSRTYTEAYQAMLARELLIDDFQDNYGKYF
ncbi:MAG: hypothetical protein P8045_08420 [Candidatus Thiodiazotropha sp.]|jgi:hypothetical protein